VARGELRDRAAAGHVAARPLNARYVAALMPAVCSQAMQVPRWLGRIVAILFCAAFYFRAPLGLSLLSERHLWSQLRTSARNG
jgi:hypothetical protein